MSDKNKRDYEVGYGKPPVSGQFKKGQSGHPPGRTPRKRSAEPTLPGHQPTQKLLRFEAERLVAVRDGSRIFKIPTTEAVIRSLAQKAMQGGVLAQRTYLALQQAEDNRIAAEKEERFNCWQSIVEKARKLWSQAREKGEPEPDFLPHPDDVIFDYVNREVRIVGPINAAEAKDVKERKELSDLMYEMSLFLEEIDFGKPTDEHPIYGKFLYFYLLIFTTLPPRLRKFDEELHEAIVRRTFGRRANWAAYLNQRFKELGKETDVTKVRTQPVDLRDLGMRFGPNGLEEYRWPKRRNRAEGTAPPGKKR